MQAEQENSLAITLVGDVQHSDAQFVIINTEHGTRAVKVGQKLGDFLVSRVSEEGVIFTHQGKEYLVRWESGRLTKPRSGTADFYIRLEQADCVYAFQSIAAASGLNFYCGTQIVGYVSLEGSFSQEELLNNLTNQITFTDAGYSVTDGNLIVAKRSKIPTVKQALSEPAEEPLVSFNFVNAQLWYVLKVLAEEMGIQPQISESIEGAVTISSNNTAANRLLGAVLALQDNRYEVERNDSALRVEPQ